MDINALLSPTESGSRVPSPSVTPSPRPPRNARPAGGKRTTSGLSNEVSRQQPEAFPSRPTSAHLASASSFTGSPAPAAAPNFRPLQPPPTSNPSPAAVRGSPVADGYAQQRPGIAHRPSSTPELNVLASVAQTQSHGRQPPTSRPSSSADIHQHQHLRRTPQRSPTYAHAASPAKPLLFRNASGKSSTDLIMAEAPAMTPPPRDFESGVLTDTESSLVTDLLSHLSQKSYDYDSHVQLVNLLHKGLLAHVHPPLDGDEQTLRDPRSYPLLTELRQAREAMDTRFAVGEDLWADWLSDEVLLASNSEERISVTELCGKAVQDEPASVKLWQMYADWVQNNYATCNNLEGSNQSKWTEEDKEMCRELFTRDMLVNVLEQGIQTTQWRIDQSHTLWNRYADLVLQDVPARPSAKDVENVRNMFVHRLQIPQAAWSETAQTFYQAMSRLDPNKWEMLMDQVGELSQSAKMQMSLREPYELELQRAIDSGDKNMTYYEFEKYLRWEKKQSGLKRRATFQPDLLCALYERALLRFPTVVEWWLDYIDFVTTSSTSTPPLPLIERASRHCPWSGDLWARRILQSDVEGKSREDIEATKHRATNSGLLDVGGMEELLKVLQQWCSYLRRHAFSIANAEDEIDTAEFGISSALQDIDDAGRKVYGKDFEGDPLYRLEAIQIKFLSEARRFEEARDVYKNLVPKQKNSHDFWAAYYNWELWLWGYDRVTEKHRIETAENGPKRATAVVRQALAQKNLDWPERVHDMFLNHFQQHESGMELRQALSEAREFSKHLAVRRAKEAEEAAAVQQQAYQAVEAPFVDGQAPAGEKRKREEDVLPNGHNDKKTRTDAGAAQSTEFGEPSGSASAQIKRDRENNTITVKNLPAGIQELDVRKFFREVGDPVSITLIADPSSSTATATVEFSTHEDVLAAKTRNGKDLLGNEVRILSGSQSTLYVANYPAEYDEAAMRGLFEGYGEIISVRFPSLKFNNRRRFCYIQFLTSEMARAAEAALDGKMLDGAHKLLAKISDPDAKKSREGAQAEGRELFVKNLDRDAQESEVKEFFEQYGNVVSMNMVKLVSGKKTGTAFVVFSSADEATKALEANNKPFRDRILHVEIASAKGRAAPLDRARREDIVVKHSASPDPPDAQNGGRRTSTTSSHPEAGDGEEPSYRTARERKVAIFNLPDTVNDARVRAAMEAHGALVKIQMRRQDGGAIVEFASVKDAFNVRQGVDCSGLGEGVRTGEVGELLAKVKKRQGEEGGGGGMMRPAAVSRPRGGGGGQRGRGRGGLGFRKGGGAGGSASTVAEGGAAGGAAKSNADFKAMFEKSKGGDGA